MSLMNNSVREPADDNEFYAEHETLIDTWMPQTTVVRLFDMINGRVKGVGSAFLIATTSCVEDIKVHDWVLDTAPAGYRFTEVQMLLRSGQGVPN